MYINKREYLPAASLGRGDQRDFSHFKGLWLPWRAGELCLPASRRLSWVLALSSSPPSFQLLKLSQTPSCVLGGLVGVLIWQEGEKPPLRPVNATSKGLVAMATSSLSQEGTLGRDPGSIHKHCHSVQSLAGLVAVPVDVTCMLTTDHSPSAPAPVPRAHPLLHCPQAAPSTIAKHHECSWHWGR